MFGSGVGTVPFCRTWRRGTCSSALGWMTSSRKVWSMHMAIIFKCLTVICNHAGYNPLESQSRHFLSWQTWDLFRIMWYGFKEFCCSFTSKHPGYYVTPPCLNGSPFETLFSQLKFISHGNLTSVCYPQALASQLTKGSIHGHSVAGSSSYRNVTLFVRKHDLQK